MKLNTHIPIFFSQLTKTVSYFNANRILMSFFTKKTMTQRFRFGSLNHLSFKTPPSHFTVPIGAKYLFFVSSRSVKTRELSFAQFVYFLRKECLFFNFWMIKFTIMFCFDIVVNFIIQKLKKTHTFFKNYTNWAKLSSLVLT